MQKPISTETRRSLLFCFVFLGLAAAFVLAPFQFRSEANNRKSTGKELSPNSKDKSKKLENYDIRTDKSAAKTLSNFRSKVGKSDFTAKNDRRKMESAEDSLRTQIPTLKVEYRKDLQTPEVITPDVKQGKAFLTSATSAKRTDVLRNFIKENDGLIGLVENQPDDLRVAADYTNPDGNLSFTHLQQFINDIPVFQGEIKAGFRKNGEMIRIINDLAPGLDQSSVSGNFGSPEDAVSAAFGNVERSLQLEDTQKNTAASTDSKAVFGEGNFGTTAEKMYFPTESGVARPAWRILIWEDSAAYYLIVDAETGSLLWRKNIVAHQTQPATYGVYANSTSMLQTLDSPAPLSPGIIDPTTGTQAPLVPRTNVSLIGNEAPNTFNNLGWITDGGTLTDGNNVEAGVDRDTLEGTSPYGIDANGKASAADRVFSFNYNPGAPGNTGDAPTPNSPGSCSSTATAPLTDYQKGVVTHLFYITNRYHDEMYKLGFTESARNFQNNNFGRGGFSNDRISAEAQDCGNTNNASFGTPPDGFRGLMEMNIYTRPIPDRDSSLDADVVAHELTHGLSNRLIGNAAGLSNAMSAAMGEGWSDFYATALLSEPTDTIDGIYPSGGYINFSGSTTFAPNYYYGDRRFPYAIKSSVGGANNRPHNPMTFADIDGSQINLNDGAFSSAFTGTSDQLHNAGTVWATALFEVRGKFIQRLGHVEGNRRVLQIVTDGMKLSPLNPTFLQARDAIIAAAQANAPGQDSPDTVDVWSGFALRGMGFSARILNIGNGGFNGNGSTRVAESFDAPNVTSNPNFSFTIATGNGNEFPEPGETLVLTLPLTNNTGVSANDVSVQVIGGGSANYGNMANNATVSRTLNFAIPANTQCGSELALSITINSSLGSYTQTRTIRIGAPVLAFAEKFDGVSVPTLPSGWSSSLPNISVPNTGLPWRTTTTSPASAPNAVFGFELTTPSLVDLESPVVTTTEPNAQLKFDIKYDTEPSYDGAVLEIKIGSGSYQDILAAGGTFVSGGYNSSFATNSDNPIEGRSAWTGNSGGYISTSINLPASVINQPIQFRWRIASDTTLAVEGVYIDNIQILNGYSCSFVPTTVKSPFDFDGDGKTDLSIFRPAPGEWWFLRSSDGGNSTFQFGNSSDKLVPADFTGDGKTDIALFRPSTNEWFVLRSEDSSFYSFPFGAAGDVPVPADYDGDGKADPAVFRPSTQTWFILRSSGGTTI
ncbi:MAG: M36 family metallopeptidase, partial [Acidobacteriota bacterium]|nr:M36 family metallopeptidase [Acidobacteriota bacterium]